MHISFEWTWRLLWHFLQVLKSKSESRRKKEKSVNKTLCIRLKIILIPRRNFYFYFFQKLKFWNIWCSFQITLTCFLKKNQISKTWLLWFHRGLLVSFKMSAFLSVYFTTVIIHCCAEPDSSVKWIAEGQSDLFKKLKSVRGKTDYKHVRGYKHGWINAVRDFFLSE